MKHYRKVFNCPACQYQTPGGFVVNAANCPFCKTAMDKIRVEILTDYMAGKKQDKLVTA